MRRVVIACLVLVPSVARADLMLRLLEGDGGTGGGSVTGAPPSNPDDLIAWAGTPKQVALPELLQQAIRQAPTLQNAKIDIAVAEAQIAETWERHDWLFK